MILNYNYNKKQQNFRISYITDSGGKRILKYNRKRFECFVEDESGPFENWNGDRCNISLTDKPSKFDLLHFIHSLPELSVLQEPHNPKLYAFDIEVQVDPDEFPEPSIAKFPIYTISIVNDKLDSVVLGTRKMDQDISADIWDYIKDNKFLQQQNISQPKFHYIHFETEKEMLEYFLKNIVAKAAVITGWNSIMFDWNYIVNRCKRLDVPLYICDIEGQIESKRQMDMRGTEITLPMPVHTWVTDMMDLVNTFDMTVMPIKDSLSLDYIGSQSPVGMSKIKYEGSLEDLYNTDYPKYVFYNVIDSIIVQLIDKCFGVLNNLYAQALYCTNAIPKAVSKIALTETLFWNYWKSKGIKVVTPKRFEGDRGELVGAYVAVPVAGRHKWICCSDFASLYPSTIICCNLSVENLVEHHTKNPEKYGPGYFVSVNGNVYKNDKDYAFKEIQLELKNNRNTGKYLAKALDAQIIYDLHHTNDREYSQNVIEYLASLGYDIKTSQDLKKYPDLEDVVLSKIRYFSAYEQACKYLGNGAYGASSNLHFAFFDIDVANDITGEARNLIKIMEKEIPAYFEDNWLNDKELHKELGIHVS